MKKNGARIDLHDGDEEKVGDDLGQEELRAGRGNHALRVHDLVANLARPGLIERADRSEHGGHAQHAAGDLLRELAPRIEGDGEEHHHQAREEQHGDHGVERAPLDAEIFDEMGPEGAGHLRALREGAFVEPAWPPAQSPVFSSENWKLDGAPSVLVSFVRSAVSTGSPMAAAARR